MRLAVWPVLPARALARALGDLVTDIVEVEPFEARSALDEGRADIALIPTLDVLRSHAGLEVIPGVALVGEKSPRRRLVVGAALDQIETIAFDPRDAQEALLMQLVLREHYGAHPTFQLPEGAGLAEILDRQSAALVGYGDALPEGVFVLDPAREWTDLTLRPFVWGLLAVAEGALGVEAARRLRAAVQEAPVSDDLFVDGVGAYQLTLDGYANDGLEQLAEYLFETGTLDEVPAVPFLQIPEEGEESDDEG